jgi:hypothetical protein
MNTRTSTPFAILRLGVASLAVAVMVASPALAERGNGNGNSNSNSQGNANGQGKDGNNGRGAISSELRGLNAAHASDTAFLNASPNSQVGRIAVYRDAAVATETAKGEWASAYDAYLAYQATYTGPTAADLTALLAATDPTAPEYATLTSQLQTAQTYETELARLAGLSNDAAGLYQEAAAIEDGALIEASGGRTLSEGAIAELRALLGL